MCQTHWVIDQLRTLDAQLTFEIIPVITRGDKQLDVALSKIGGKGLFVSEVEAWLQSGQGDLAVHSLKDIPVDLAPGLMLAGMPTREDPRDALISRGHERLADLPAGSVVGTSSLRRVAQLQHLRPDLHYVPVRGNIDTRLRKLDSGELDAIVLAAAGLHRMGWQERIDEYLDPSDCLPAIGQGVLGLECRTQDDTVRALLARLSDASTVQAVQAERTLLRALNGGCQVPLGGYAEVLADGSIHLRGMVATVDGTTILQAEGTHREPVAVGSSVAQALLHAGADQILRDAVVTEG